MLSAGLLPGKGFLNFAMRQALSKADEPTNLHHPKRTFKQRFRGTVTRYKRQPRLDCTRIFMTHRLKHKLLYGPHLRTSYTTQDGALPLQKAPCIGG